MNCSYCGKSLEKPRKKYCTDNCARLAWKKANYGSDRESIVKVRQRRQKERREYLRKLKDNPCKDCGVKYPYYVMQFDHIKGDKVKAVSLLVNYSWETLKAEVAKCELVCANCHMERTFSRAPFAKIG